MREGNERKQKQTPPADRQISDFLEEHDVQNAGVKNGFTNYVKYIGKIVLVLAVVIGCIGRYDPTLFFYIPKVGFLFHIATTGKPPQLFVYDAWTPQSTFRSWIKPSDVVVATGSKSGTNWMLYCSHQIRMYEHLDIADELWKDVNYNTPWPSLRQNPGMSFSEEIKLYNSSVSPSTGVPLRMYWDNPLYPFRIFKSHEYPVESGGVLHVRENPNVKFVAMTRNMADVSLSFINFMKKHAPEFRQMLGGFPPEFQGKTFEEEADRVLGFLHGKKARENKDMSFYAYIRGWWSHRHDPNVLYLHYSDAIRDLGGTISKLASFYDIKLTEKQHAKIVQRCGIDHMKQLDQQGKFAYRLPLNRRFGEITLMKSDGGMIHKGGSHGRAAFTRAQLEFISATEEEELGHDPELLRWSREGGKYS